MRTHGWGGDPPTSDDEAIARILRATRQCIDVKASSTSITDVAELLRVTRPTIYRYFASTDDLLRATAIDATGDFMDRLATHVEHIDDPGSAVVELVAYTLEHLSSEPYIGLLLTSGRASTFAQGVTSTTAMAFGHSFFQRVNVDWKTLGLEGDLFDEFVEHVLRMFQSLVLDPGDPPRTGDALRRYLARWMWSSALRLDLDPKGQTAMEEGVTSRGMVETHNQRR